MRKILILLLLSLPLLAQTKKEIYNDVKTAYKEAKIKESIDVLAKELKTTTTALWTVLVKQQTVWSYCYLALLIVSLLNWFSFYKRSISEVKYEKCDVLVSKPMYEEGTTESNAKDYPNTYKRKFRDVVEQDFKIVPTSNVRGLQYIHLMACICGTLLSIYNFPSMLTGFLNPEFGAIQTISDVIQNLK